jgi:hypothetical protein
MGGSRRTVKLRDICTALDVSDRDGRYVLERGFVPKGVRESPGSGDHREFSPYQAYWLGIVFKLKQSGLKTPLAANIADYADAAIRTTTQNLGWDWPFLPKAGRFDTEHKYYIDVADLKYIRLVTDACPDSSEQDCFDWHTITKPRRAVKDVFPCVLIRLDVALIASKVGLAFRADDMT